MAMKRRTALTGVLGLGMALASSITFSQEYSQPLRIIVPGAAGQGLDLLARIFAGKLAVLLKRPVVVENRVGAGGIVAAQVAARSAPDGNTLFFGFAATHGILSSLHKTLPYDPVRDFEPIVPLTYSSNVLVTSKQSGLKTMAQLVAAGRKKPENLTMGSPGEGTTPHLSGAILDKMAGMKSLHVPIKTNPGLEVIAGRVDYAFLSTPVAVEFVKTDRVNALAVTSPVREAKLPDVPTMIEAGFPGYTVTAWCGLFAPAKTSAAFIRQVNEAANTALKDASLIASLMAISSTPIGGTPDDLRKRVQDELAKWPEVVKDAGVQVN
ncbi:tripartite tricarboxylate transporter substrate binding protein [Variovorax sp. E3]|uniref:Bug family tripartite tricarboxylate transporter substrate binding protein n=1 Tax=Variovorax sp. E3 TaxID=1914993 RepID=UPI0018DBC16A|nr:tripartite tricarboxylate transporter substrate-binding protein [Variovorax sp. E3]